MKKLKNLSKEEALEIIETVVNRIAPRYTFNGYDLDDIKQESFIICMDALNRYDSKRPLENFLSVNLSNRLKNFIRDNFGNAKDVEKKKITDAKILSNQSNHQNHSYEFDTDYIDIKNIMETIDEKLPPHMREDFLKYIHNVSLSKQKREALIETIKDIINNEEG